MRRHPIGVPCPTCTQPGALFAYVHVPGPPCLVCSVSCTFDDGDDYWTCHDCGTKTRADRDGSRPLNRLEQAVANTSDAMSATEIRARLKSLLPNPFKVRRVSFMDLARCERFVVTSDDWTPATFIAAKAALADVPNALVSS